MPMPKPKNIKNLDHRKHNQQRIHAKTQTPQNMLISAQRQQWIGMLPGNPTQMPKTNRMNIQARRQQWKTQLPQAQLLKIRSQGTHSHRTFRIPYQAGSCVKLQTP
jgi:hypothetical protein